MNWRLGLLILLGVAIVVVVILYRKRVFEGFQTPPATPVVEPSVFIVDPAYLTNRFPQIRVVQGVMSGVPAGLTGLTGKLSKADAYTLCSRLGATMARIDDVRKAKRNGVATWTDVGWVDDIETPINTTKLTDRYEYLGKGSKGLDILYAITGGSFITTDTSAYAICIGQTTPQTDWNLVPSSEAELPALVNTSATDSATTMTIFDPTAAYVQADIAAIEYPVMMSQILQNDATLPTDSSSDANQTKISQYFWWMKNYSSFSSSLYYWAHWTYRGIYINILSQITAGYTEEYNSSLTEYAAANAALFRSHPIAYIMKDYEKIKTTEFTEGVNNADFINDMPLNNRGQTLEGSQDSKPAPPSITKVNVIDDSKMPKGYPRPGYLCIPTFNDYRNKYYFQWKDASRTYRNSEMPAGWSGWG